MVDFDLKKYLYLCIINRVDDFSIDLPERLRNLAHTLGLTNEGIASLVIYDPQVLSAMSADKILSQIEDLKPHEREYKWSRITQELSKQHGIKINWSSYLDMLKRMGHGDNPDFKNIPKSNAPSLNSSFKKNNLLSGSASRTNKSKRSGYGRTSDNPFADDTVTITNEYQEWNSRKAQRNQKQEEEDLYAWILLRCSEKYQQSRKMLDAKGQTEEQFMSGTWKELEKQNPILYKKLGSTPQWIPNIKFIPAFPEGHPLLLKTPEIATNDSYYRPLKYVTTEQLTLLNQLLSDQYPKVSVQDIKDGIQSLEDVDIEHKDSVSEQKALF